MGAEVASAGVLSWFAALCVYDIRHRRLPNMLTLPGAVALLLGATSVGCGRQALCGAVALFVVYLAVHLAAPTAMGAGDVKLAIGVGALTGAFGADVWILAALGAPLLTAAVTCVALVRRTESAVPHGPSMCVATLAALALVVV